MSVAGGLAAGLALALPGLALIRREEWARAEPFELAALAFGGSAAVWAVLIWFQPYLGLGWTALVVVVTAAAGAWLVAARRAQITAAARVIAVTWQGRAELAALAALIALRVAFLWTRLACSVGDMTAHGYMTELIVLRDAMPTSHEPLLAIEGFGQFSPGFHAVSALAALLSGIPSYRTTMLILALSVAGLSCAAYAVLRGLGVPRAPATIGAIGALLIARNPQFIQQWGGAPTLLAAVLALLLLRDTLRLAGSCDAALLVRAGLLGAGAVLCHLLPVASFLYVATLALLVRAAPEPRALLGAARSGAVVALVASALILPFVRVTPLGITPRIAAWAHDWFRDETARAVSLEPAAWARAGAGAHTWPFYLIVYLGLLPAALLLAGLALRGLRRRDHALRMGVALVALHFTLFAGGLAEVLPLWPSLYPTRIGIWLVVPLGVALATLAEAASERLPRRALAGLGAVWVAGFAAEGWLLSGQPFGTLYYEAAKRGRASPVAIAAHEALGGAFWVGTYCRDNAPLTEDDLRAFAWIREHTPEDAVFGTNYGDGGDLITTIAHRKVLAPHYYFFFYEDQYETWRARTAADYIYLGSEASPAWIATYRYRRNEVEADPRHELVFRSGEARVYRVRRP